MLHLLLNSFVGACALRKAGGRREQSPSLAALLRQVGECPEQQRGRTASKLKT